MSLIPRFVHVVSPELACQFLVNLSHEGIVLQMYSFVPVGDLPTFADNYERRPVKRMGEARIVH